MVAEADDGEVVLAQVQETVPDVVWLDLRLAGPAPSGWPPSIRQVVPTARVVGRRRPDDHDARRRAVRAGAVGVVDREQTAAGAAEVTRRVAWGRCELGPADLEGLLATYAAFARQAGSVQQQVAPPTLDDRQQQVLELLAAGRTAGRGRPPRWGCRRPPSRTSSATRWPPCTATPGPRR